MDRCTIPSRRGVVPARPYPAELWRIPSLLILVLLGVAACDGTTTGLLLDDIQKRWNEKNPVVVPSTTDVLEGEVDALIPGGLSIRVVDQNNTAFPNLPVVWSFDGGVGATEQSEAFEATIHTTLDQDGTSTVRWRLGKAAGDQVATATIVGPDDADGSTLSVSFKGRGRPGPAAVVEVTPDGLRLEMTEAADLDAVAVDKFGNPRQGASIRWSSTNDDVAEVDDAGMVKAMQPGSATITASSGGVTGTASVEVVAPDAVLAILAGDGQTAAPGETLATPPEVVLRDGSGTPLAGVTIEWAASAGGTATPASSATDAGGRARVDWTLGDTPGTQQLTAAIPGFSQVSFTAEAVEPVVVESVQISPASASLEAGAALTFSVEGTLSDGSTGSVPVAWSATGGSIDDTGAYTAGPAAGSFRVVATHATGPADTATVTIEDPSSEIASLEVRPDSATLEEGTGRTFRAVAIMADGSETSPAVTWAATGGTVTSAGRYTAGSTPGTYRVVATHAQGFADTARVTVEAAPPTVESLEIRPDSATVEVGGTARFDAVAHMSDGAESDVDPTWAAAGGTIDATGLFTAGDTPGSYAVVATHQGVADTVPVVVEAAAPDVAGIEVRPGTATVDVGGTVQFDAVALMSDGSETTAAATWSATGGSIDDGLYSAGSTAGEYEVVARHAEGFADTASVTIEAAVVTVEEVEVRPGEATLEPGATQAFSAVALMSDGSETTPEVTWSATGGTVTQGGSYTAGSADGSFQVAATLTGGAISGQARITIYTPVTGGPPDPMLLPAANHQSPSGSYGRNLSAGGSYIDPSSGARVFKITDASTPVSNGGAFHDYSNNGPQISLPWQSGGDTYYTIYVNVGPYYLVDFNYSRGTFGNWRPGPQVDADLAFTFSLNPATPRIAYFLRGGVLNRYDTSTDAVANTGNFPHDPAASGLNVGVWLQNSVNDEVFSWIHFSGSPSYGVVWRPSDDTEVYAHDGSLGSNETYLDRSGDYLYSSAQTGGLEIIRLSDGQNLGEPDDRRNVVHSGVGRDGHVFTLDPDTNGGYQLFWVRAEDQTDHLMGAAGEWVSGIQGAESHQAAGWVFGNGSGPDQWSVIGVFGRNNATNPGKMGMCICILRPGDNNVRFLTHHDSSWGGAVDYFQSPFAHISPDGRLVLFNSNMNDSGRGDVFVALVPTS